jgi:type IV secretory pathway component VirB8
MKDLKRVRELNKEIRWFLYLFIPFFIFGVLSSILLGVMVARLL